MAATRMVIAMLKQLSFESTQCFCFWLQRIIIIPDLDLMGTINNSLEKGERMTFFRSWPLFSFVLNNLRIDIG